MDFNKMINEMMAEGMDADAIAESFTKSLNAEMARQKAEAEKNSIAVEKRADMMEILLAIEDFLYDYYGDEMDILNAKDESFTPEDADKLIAELDNWFGTISDLLKMLNIGIKNDDCDEVEKNEDDCGCCECTCTCECDDKEEAASLFDFLHNLLH